MGLGTVGSLKSSEVLPFLPMQEPGLQGSDNPGDGGGSDGLTIHTRAVNKPCSPQNGWEFTAVVAVREEEEEEVSGHPDCA